MRYRQLDEGVKYGAKEKNSILSNLEEFGFGIEIELKLNENVDTSEIHSEILRHISDDQMNDLFEQMSNSNILSTRREENSNKDSEPVKCIVTKNYRDKRKIVFDLVYKLSELFFNSSIK